MRSPCLSCELLPIDKNNPTCEKCDTRLQYVAQIDPERISGVPRFSVGNTYRVDPEENLKLTEEVQIFAGDFAFDHGTMLDELLNFKNRDLDSINLRYQLFESILKQFNSFRINSLGQALGIRAQHLWIARRRMRERAC